jgi:hypothetical protein
MSYESHCPHCGKELPDGSLCHEPSLSAPKLFGMTMMPRTYCPHCSVELRSNVASLCFRWLALDCLLGFMVCGLVSSIEFDLFLRLSAIPLYFIVSRSRRYLVVKKTLVHERNR